MTVQPFMKFYCADWRADPRLRMCSLAARGLWIDLMSYMHEGEPYGHLTIDGKQPDLAGIASLVARPLKEVKAAIAELEDRNVFSRGEEGEIYSRRMVRDKAKAIKERENGTGGGNPKLRSEDNGGVNPQVNGRDKAQILEVRNQKKEDAGPSGPPSDEADLYRRGKEVLGPTAGGLVSKLLKNKKGSVPLARAAIEQAATKQDAREYIGRILAGPVPDGFKPMSGMEGVM